MANLGKSVKGKNKKKKDEKVEKVIAGKARRLFEVDINKRLGAITRKLMRETLDRERAMTKLNNTKIQNAWQKILRLAKVESLRKEVEIVSQNHERDVDRKDAIIQMLDRDVEEAEDQYQTALRHHLRNIDRLIDVQDERLQSLEVEFDEDIATLEKEFFLEKQEIKTRFDADKAELQAVTDIIAGEVKERTSDAKSDHEQAREIIRTKSLDCIHVLQSSLDNQIEEMERAFESAHLAYLGNTDQRTQEFKDLTQADKVLSEDIELKVSKIAKLQSSLQFWRSKLAADTKESEERNTTMKAEKEAVSNHFQALKAKMNLQRETQKRRLTELSAIARETVTTLQSQNELAERILSQSERARLLETEREKVAPFESETFTDMDEALTTGAGKLGGAGLGAIISEAEMTALSGFHRRYNRVLMDKLTLARERERLAHENSELQSVLKQYLEGVSVSSGAVSVPNSLLIINNVSSIAVPVAMKGQPTVIQEAVMIMATRRIR